MHAAHLLVLALVAGVADEGPVPPDPAPAELRKAGRQCERGARYLLVGNVRRAARYFERALTTVPGYPEAHLGLGHVAMRERRFEDALHDYRLAEEGYRELGDRLIQRRTKVYRDAQIEISRLHRSMEDVEWLGSQYKLTPAQTYRKLSEMRQAIDILEAIEPPGPDATGRSPGQVDFYIGNALFRLDRFDEALEAWERSAERAPRFPLVYNNLAVAYWRIGRISEARRCLAQAESLGLRVNPNLRRELETAAGSGAGEFL